MITLTMQFDSEQFVTDGLCNKFEVNFDCYINDVDDEIIIDDLHIFDVTANVERKESELTTEEQARLEEAMLDYAWHRHSDLIEDLMCRGEAAAEMMEDR